MNESLWDSSPHTAAAEKYQFENISVFFEIHVIVLNTGKLFGHTTLSSILTAAVGKQIAESIMLDNSHILIIYLIFEIIYKVYNN